MKSHVNLLLNQSAADRPDIVASVFNQKRLVNPQQSKVTKIPKSINASNKNGIVIPKRIEKKCFVFKTIMIKLVSRDLFCS
jgi:predicted Zn-ribbon and HTH transcriptional regulator